MRPDHFSRALRCATATILATVFLQAGPARAEVVLQYFESTWDEMYQRIPEISEAGYDAVWTPPPCKSPEAGTIPWGNVGYSLYDRFDIGDTPQRGTLATRYGTRGDLRNMVDSLHDCDVKIYPDMVINHNGNGPNYLTYPGMVPNDFHIWQDASQPGGWKRPARMTAYDDISNGLGGTFQQELVSLMDLVTESDGRFQGSNAPNYTPDPTPFIRHPGRNDLYPYGAPSTENVRQMMNRWAAWLGNAMDYDGFRIDAAKHVVREFYGGPGSGFLDAAQYNFHVRRGYTYDNSVPDLYKNDIQRHDMLMFSEIFSGASSTFDYWRQGNVKMRYLDFPQKINLLDNAFNNNNLGVLATLGTALDPTEGVMFVQSHDQPAPNKLTLAYAYLLTHVGVPVVYFSGNNISWNDYNVKTWVKPGVGDALGDYDNFITNLVYISNQFARGREWNRWSDSGFYAFERYTDSNANSTIDSGESTLLVALNNTGGDVTHTLSTAFPNGTVLHDYTGHNGNDLTVSNGQVTVTVPANSGQGYVCYAPYNATANGEPLRFIQSGTQVGTVNWVVPGGRDASAKPRVIPHVTGNSVDIEVDYFDPSGSYVDNVLVKWGQGRLVNSGTTVIGGNDPVSAGFQQATYVGPAGKWKLTADLTNVPEGLNVIKARAFTHRDAGLPAIYQTFTKVIYVDRTGPSLGIGLSGTLSPDGVATITNADKTAGAIEANIDGGPWGGAAEVMRGTWKYTITGLAAGQHTLNIRAHEYDNGSTKTEINSNTASQTFTVSAGTPNIAMNWIEGQTIYLPFPVTTITVDPAVTASSVKMWWDGWQMTNLSGTGSITHVFDGSYVSGGVQQKFWGAFINGPHFFEAEVTVNGQTKHIARTVNFNLYGQNMVDSDGDGLPDDIEIPGTLNGINPNTPIAGDSNLDAIPNYGETWTQLNPLNHDTFYAGRWDGDRYGVNYSGTGATNLQKVWQGFLRYGDAYHYNIYNANSQPETGVSPQAATALTSSSGQKLLTVDYRAMSGALSTAGQVYARLTMDGSTTTTYAMPMSSGGAWELKYAVPSGAQHVSIVFQNADGSVTDANSSTSNISVNIVPLYFNLDGQFDSANYEVANTGMKIHAALKGTQLYVATWSPKGGGNDHFLFVTDQFGNSEAAPWAKAGTIQFSKSSKPWLAGESTTVGGSNFNTFNNRGSTGGSAMGANGQALEGVLDLQEVFGYVPKVLYMAAVAYGTNDGDGINAQCPYPWSADNILQTEEFQPVATDSIRDEDLDGYFDAGKPAMETVVNGNTADANYGLRRFFINEIYQDSGQITVNLYPNVAPTATVTSAQVITNLNRRDFATLDYDVTNAATGDNTAYFRAYQMTPNGGGGFTVTLPVNKCGVYRITARYQVNDNQWYYYTDHAQRRDCVVVVSPKKAQTAIMYEVNPMVVEATGTTFATRSTFRDLYTANSDRPDIINLQHFPGIGVNTIWLQPVHPIGLEATGTDPVTTQPYVPGSPYAVRDYWSVNPALGADNTASGAMNEFVTFVQQMDSIGVNVMMDATFNHSSPDALMGQGAADLFGFDPSAQIRNLRPQWFSKTGQYNQPASNAGEIAVAPDRSDFGKWDDVRDFYFGDYDALVKTANDADQDNFLLERDDFSGHTAYTKEIWKYFAYYPVYWLKMTGCPPGTPPEQSFKGIDGLRCDFAQGLPSQFWEYCINTTRCVKWDFLFMAESLDGYRTVNGGNRHGVGYRSARQFDILNENIVFYWRDQFFAYPANGAGSAGMANPTTYPTWQAYDNRRNAYDNVVLLNNLTSHDEVFPSNDPYSLFYAYAELGAIDGIPMMLYGQEAGARNDFATYAFSGVTESSHNWTRYELNFGKSIPNFKCYNSMSKVWQNRDWNLQTLYGRVNHARQSSQALQSQNVYYLSGTGGGYDPNIFAVAKYQSEGVSAAWQDVVFAFVNNNYQGSTNRWQTFNVNALAASGSNRFGIVPGHTYNLVNLLASDITSHVWSQDVGGAALIASGITVGLTTSGTGGGQAQYLKLIDTGESHAGQPNPFVSPSTVNDNIPDWWKQQYGFSVTNPTLAGTDPYGTGMTVYQHYLAGTNPTQPGSRLRVNSMQTDGQTLDLSWQAVAGQNYKPRYSLDLATWQDFTDVNGVPLIYTADSTLPTAHLVLPAVTQKMFFRVDLKR